MRNAQCTKRQADSFGRWQELYQNALDHGVLALDSAQKANSNRWFNAYYRNREKRWAELQSGSVRVELANHPSATGGVLEVQVSDSGAGFDHQALPDEGKGEGATYGRGIRLIHSFCHDLKFLGRGNRVRALFSWH